MGKFDSIIDNYLNGNLSDCYSAIRKLSRNDRARIVAYFRCNVSTKIAFEIAEKIIKLEL